MKSIAIFRVFVKQTGDFYLVLTKREKRKKTGAESHPSDDAALDEISRSFLLWAQLLLRRYNNRNACILCALLRIRGNEGILQA